MTLFLYTVLILLFPFGVIPRYTFFGNISVSMIDLICFLIVVINTSCIFNTLKKNSTFVKLILAFIFISLVGDLLNSQTYYELISSIAYLVRLSLYLLFFIPLLFLHRVKILIIKKALFISVYLFVIFGYIQYFLYPNLRNLYYLGWDEHLYRLFSTFLDPNFAGVFIVLGINYSFYLLFNEFNSYSFLKKILSFLFFIILVLSLFLTYSRSAFLAFIVSFVLISILNKKIKLLLAFVCLCIFSLIILPKNFGGEGVNLLRTASFFQRFDSYFIGFQLFLNNPIFGVGFNNIRFQLLDNFTQNNSIYYSHAGAGFPNSYLYILTTTGLMGFSVFILFMYFLLQKLIFLFKFRKDKFFYSTVIASFISVLIVSMFDNFLFFPIILLWLIILTGIALKS